MLADVAAVNSTKELPVAFAKFAQIGVANPFGVRVGQDPKQSTVNIVQIGQWGTNVASGAVYDLPIDLLHPAKITQRSVGQIRAPRCSHHVNRKAGIAVLRGSAP